MKSITIRDLQHAKSNKALFTLFTSEYWWFQHVLVKFPDAQLKVLISALDKDKKEVVVFTEKYPKTPKGILEKFHAQLMEAVIMPNQFDLYRPENPFLVQIQVTLNTTSTVPYDGYVIASSNAYDDDSTTKQWWVKTDDHSWVETTSHKLKTEFFDKYVSIKRMEFLMLPQNQLWGDMIVEMLMAKHVKLIPRSLWETAKTDLVDKPSCDLKVSVTCSAMSVVEGEGEAYFGADEMQFRIDTPKTKDGGVLIHIHDAHVKELIDAIF